MRPPPPLPSPCFLVDLPPQGLLLLLPPWAPLEEVVPCLCGAPAPPALGLGADTRRFSATGVKVSVTLPGNAEPRTPVSGRPHGDPGAQTISSNNRRPVANSQTAVKRNRRDHGVRLRNASIPSMTLKWERAHISKEDGPRTLPRRKKRKA